jgi:epoxide hydrolase 4
MTSALQHSRIRLSEVELHVVSAGPPHGPLVVLLHGFPEFWYGWRRQIPALAEAGYRVVVPDQRGYNTSDKPKGVEAYGLDRLTRDVAELIKAEGRDRARIVGHDWGGFVAWWLAVTRPEVVEQVALLNIPHPSVMRHHLLTNPKQLRKSGYALFFQLPGLPEKALTEHGSSRLVRSLFKLSRPGSFREDDIPLYREAWEQPGAMTAMLNWYRAAARAMPERPPSLRVTPPALLIWGTMDRHLGEELAAPSVELCDRGRLVKLPNATHYVQHDEAARVNDLLREFFAEGQ